MRVVDRNEEEERAWWIEKQKREVLEWAVIADDNIGSFMILFVFKWNNPQLLVNEFLFCCVL